MKQSRFSEHQIIGILKETEAGLKVSDLCRKYGISETTYDNWKAKYGGMESSDVKRLRDLEEENRWLKQIYAHFSLDHQILKEVLEKKSSGRIATRVGAGNHR